MPRRKNELLLRNLAQYDVFIEDTSASSPYFQITNLPSKFTGGRNSFLIKPSFLLQNGSTFLIEIIDSAGNPIYQRTIPNYTEANSKLVSVEVYNTTAVGFATIIIMGKAAVQANGAEIPSEWQNKYNVRWSHRVLTDYNAENMSPLRFVNTPQMFVEENRFDDVYNPRYEFAQDELPVKLIPLLYASQQRGYRLEPVPPAVFSSQYVGGTFTGSLKINNKEYNLALPITTILNSTQAFTYNYLIGTPSNYVSEMVLQSGSYNTQVNLIPSDVTSSVLLEYQVLTQPSDNPTLTSFANIRIANLNTVSGEVKKVRFYQKSVTNTGDFKLVGEVPTKAEELLVTSTIRGNVPYGFTDNVANINDHWIAGNLVSNQDSNAAVYPLSGSSAYYSGVGGDYTVQKDDTYLLSSLYAPINIVGSEFAPPVNQTGYFIGNTMPTRVFATTEYTFSFVGMYRNVSESVSLQGMAPRVDIYVVGGNDTTMLLDNPLGQYIGRLSPESSPRLYENAQFNFVPNFTGAGNVYIRFVVSNGFWYFSNISLTPAEDTQFSPDEVQITIPNTDYYKQVIQYKAEFLTADNSSVPIAILSTPSFFTGSVVDMGLLPASAPLATQFTSLAAPNATLSSITSTTPSFVVNSSTTITLTLLDNTGTPIQGYIPQVEP